MSNLPRLFLHVQGRYCARFPDPTARDGRISRSYGRDKAKAEAAFDLELAEWLSNGRAFPERDDGTPANPDSILVEDLVAAYWEACVEPLYLDDDTGKPTSQRGIWRSATRYWIEGFPGRTVASLRPAEMASWRLDLCKTLSRSSVNRYFAMIRAVLDWGIGEGELLDPDRVRLTKIRKLSKGAAPKRPRVKGVPEELFKATLPHLAQEVRDLFLLMRATGMRPAEACRLNRQEIDFKPLNPETQEPLEGVWLYSPAKHKTMMHGEDKLILIGPSAQAILQPRLESRAFKGSLFVNTRGLPWNTGSLCNYLQRQLRKHGLPRWSPNQLRHSLATEARNAGSGGSLDTAQSLLGHADVSTTQGYAEKDLKGAADWMRRNG